MSDLKVEFWRGIAGLKVVEHGFGPSALRIGTEFENCAVVVDASVAGNAVEIAYTVGNQPAIGILPTKRHMEAVQDDLGIRGKTGRAEGYGETSGQGKHQNGFDALRSQMSSKSVSFWVAVPTQFPPS